VKTDENHKFIALTRYTLSERDDENLGINAFVYGRRFQFERVQF
jgi:hypothetical protein